MFRSKFSWFSRFTLLPRRVLHAPEQSIAYCLTRYKPLQAKKSEKRGIHRPQIKKTLLRSKKPLVLGFRALPAARRDFASQKSDVRLLTWLHAAAFGVAVGAPPLPRPVVAQQLRCQRSSAPPAQPRRLFAVSLLLSGWRSWLRCQLLRSVRRWVRVRVGRAVRLVRSAVSLFCADCMGFTPRLCVLRRVWRALVRTTIPPRRFKRGAIARQKRLRVLAVVQQRTRVGSAP